MSTPHHNRKRNVSRWLTATICGFVLAVSCAVVGCSSAQGESANTATDGFDRTQLSDRESTITQEPAQEQTTEAIAPTTNLGVVCIDPGHGNTADSTQTPIGPGSDETQAVEPGGTSGVSTGTAEYERNLEIALKLQAQLEARGVTVVMTRTTNDVVMSSQERAEVANASGAALFVRLHCNGSVDPSTTGFSTLVPGYGEWTSGIADESARAAGIIHPVVIAATSANDAGIIQTENLAGFNFSQVPSVLFEMGFMSNAEEDELLATESYQDALASSMADGIVQYLQTL